MKSILKTESPKSCELIASGKKTIIVCKTAPKEVPFKVYIYCTKAANKRNTLWKNKNYLYVDDRNHNAFDYPLNGKVIGEFVCDKVYERPANIIYLETAQADYLDLLKKSCLTENEVIDYCGGNLKKSVCFLSISDLKIYDKPRELGEFCTPCKNLSRGACNSNICDFSRFKLDGEYTYIICRNIITRPPQSYMYIETPD